MSLRLVPVNWPTARQFCGMWHRTHGRAPAGYLWAVGTADDDDVLVGVAIVGRPSARHLDDGMTVEVTRTITDGAKNANSMLYGAVVRGAFARGFRRVITYNQAGESGASLRAAGFRVVAELPPRKGWDTPSRPREGHGADGIARKLWEVSA